MIIDTSTMTERNTCGYYTSYELPNNCVLFVAKQTKEIEKDGEWTTREASYAERASNLTSTFSSAMIAGQTMIQKGECTEFSIQTVECVKDEEDTGMLVLMTKGEG